MKKSEYEALQRCRLFLGIEKARLDELLFRPGAKLAQAERGETVYAAHHYQRSLAILLSGSAKVYKTTGENRRVMMSRLEPGHVFGMAALFYETEAYLTEIVAARKCRILFLSKQWLEQVFAQDLTIVKNYIVLLSERIHFLNQRIQTFASGDVKERLLCFLYNLPPGEDGARILPCSMAELAELLNMSRASLYRAFQELAEEGILHREGSRVILPLSGELPG